LDEVGIDTLWRDAGDFDAAVAATPDIDRYCSSSRWVLPAQRAFHADTVPLVLRSAHGYAALCQGETPSIGRYLSALEATWGLACPLVGADAERLAYDFFREALSRRAQWDALWIGGLHRQGPAFHALARLFATMGSVRLGPVTNRYATSLANGFDGWLGQRSAGFRANLRRALRFADREGVTFERLDASPGVDPQALYARVLAIEAQSWKGMSESGFTSGSMHTFYEHTFSRIVPDGSFRGLVARIAGKDVGFVFGGVFSGTYRGLQMSFAEEHRRLELGNVMQAQMIAALAEEGVDVYDLGTEIAYKARWAEAGISTVTLVVLRR